MNSPFTVILGAGLSRRFGAPKLDAQCADQAVGSWVLRAVSAAGLPPGAVVVGPEVPHFLNEWQSWLRLQNPEPEAGLSSSIAIAARAAAAQGSDAMENRITLCAFHHLRGVHAGRLRCMGQAPDGLRWEMGIRPGVPPRLRYRSGDIRIPAVAPSLRLRWTTEPRAVAPS